MRHFRLYLDPNKNRMLSYWHKLLGVGKNQRLIAFFLDFLINTITAALAITATAIPTIIPIQAVDELIGFSMFGLDVWLFSGLFGLLVLLGWVEVVEGEDVASGFSGSIVVGIIVGVGVGGCSSFSVFTTKTSW